MPIMLSFNYFRVKRTPAPSKARFLAKCSIYSPSSDKYKEETFVPNPHGKKPLINCQGKKYHHLSTSTQTHPQKHPNIAASSNWIPPGESLQTRFTVCVITIAASTTSAVTMYISGGSIPFAYSKWDEFPSPSGPSGKKGEKISSTIINYSYPAADMFGKTNNFHTQHHLDSTELPLPLAVQAFPEEGNFV